MNELKDRVFEMAVRKNELIGEMLKLNDDLMMMAVPRGNKIVAKMHAIKHHAIKRMLHEINAKMTDKINELNDLTGF